MPKLVNHFAMLVFCIEKYQNICFIFCLWLSAKLPVGGGWSLSSWLSMHIQQKPLCYTIIMHHQVLCLKVSAPLRYRKIRAMPIIILATISYADILIDLLTNAGSSDNYTWSPIFCIKRKYLCLAFVQWLTAWYRLLYL